MGANKSNTTSNAYYVHQGNVIKLSDKENADLEKNGKFYEKFASLSGVISSIKVVDGYEDLKDLAVTLNDSGESFTLYFTVGSGYFKSFARTFPNIDLTEEVELVPTFKEEKKKSQASLLVKQNGNWLKRFYTLENMGDMPQAIPVEVNGNVVYDYKEQNEFLISEMIERVAKEALPF